MADRSRLTSRLAGMIAEERATPTGSEIPITLPPEVPVSRNVQLNIELPEDMRHALRMKALAQRSDASKVVRELIQKWLNS
jgi:hypothetical protein